MSNSAINLGMSAAQTIMTYNPARGADSVDLALCRTLAASRTLGGTAKAFDMDVEEVSTRIGSFSREVVSSPWVDSGTVESFQSLLEVVGSPGEPVNITLKSSKEDLNRYMIYLNTVTVEGVAQSDWSLLLKVASAELTLPEAMERGLDFTSVVGAKGVSLADILVAHQLSSTFKYPTMGAPGAIKVASGVKKHTECANPVTEPTALKGIQSDKLSSYMRAPAVGVNTVDLKVKDPETGLYPDETLAVFKLGRRNAGLTGLGAGVSSTSVKRVRSLYNFVSRFLEYEVFSKMEKELGLSKLEVVEAFDEGVFEEYRDKASKSHTGGAIPSWGDVMAVFGSLWVLKSRAALAAQSEVNASYFGRARTDQVISSLAVYCDLDANHHSDLARSSLSVGLSREIKSLISPAYMNQAVSAIREQMGLGQVRLDFENRVVTLDAIMVALHRVNLAYRGLVREGYIRAREEIAEFELGRSNSAKRVVKNSARQGVFNR